MPPDDAPLTHHLDTLYPLACVLAGPDAADTLLRHTYERAADTPPDDRPTDTQGWLLRLLVDTRAQATDPDSSRSPHSDTLRREVAESAITRVLPVAFAGSSEEERLVLTLDVLGAPVDTLAQALNTSPTDANQIRSQAWSALRDRLQNTLRGPERSLVDDAMSEEYLRSALREDITARFQSPPAALRSVLNAIEERAEASTRPAAPSPSSSSGEEPPSSDSVREANDAGRSQRRLIGGVLFLLLAAGIAYGIVRFQASSPAPPPALDLPSLSAAAADTLRPTYATSDPAAARTFVQTTWQRSVAVPSVTGAALQGVGAFRMGDTSVPAFVFSESDGPESITVIAFSYAVVDQLGEQVQLNASLREALAQNEELISRTANGRAAVLWRHRADILVAVAPHLSPEALQKRIVPEPGSVR
jgi:hypothetical protein